MVNEPTTTQNLAALEPPAQTDEVESTVVKASRWGKRLGMFAFMFFLIKGLLWLAVPAGIAIFASQ